jgi:hypothetical protein
MNVLLGISPRDLSVCFTSTIGNVIPTFFRSYHRALYSSYWYYILYHGAIKISHCVSGEKTTALTVWLLSV